MVLRALPVAVQQLAHKNNRKRFLQSFGTEIRRILTEIRLRRNGQKDVSQRFLQSFGTEIRRILTEIRLRRNGQKDVPQRFAQARDSEESGSERTGVHPKTYLPSRCVSQTVCLKNVPM